MVTRRPAPPLPLPVTAADRAERAAAVSEIARRVTEGRYRVPSDVVAEAVLKFHSREC